MTTAQLVIVTAGALVAVAIVALAALDATKDASSARIVAAQKHADALAGAAELAAAVGALEQATAAFQHAAERAAPGPSLVGRTVVVHTRRPDDQSVRGVLVAHHADRLVLRDAVYLHATGTQAADGLVHIPLLTMSTMQEIQLPAEPV